MGLECPVMAHPSVDVPNLRRIVAELVRQVPEGRVTTYGAIAEALGDGMASRAVGQIVADAERERTLPTHRVIRSDGRVGGNDVDGAAERLDHEGLSVREGQVREVRDHLFGDFETDYPLCRLQSLQDELAQRVDRASRLERVETVAGVDLSYRGPWRGIGTYVLMDAHRAHVQLTHTVDQATDFPYIPTYLAFRELPILLALLQTVDAVDDLADVVLVDGTGLLHHRHAGIASHLGVLMDVPTVGVTKKLLYGEADAEGMTAGDVRWVADPERPDQRLGAAVKTTGRASPIYVSIGHRVDLDTAVELVLELASTKLPEPIREADRLSREAAQQPTETPDGRQQLGA